MNPIIMALRELGGSAGTQDVYDKIIELYEVSEEELSQNIEVEYLLLSMTLTGQKTI